MGAAVRYLFLSGTRSSNSIERETPSGNKSERFVQLLARDAEEERITEERLVDLQNVIVKDAYAQEASYRTKQNWLKDGIGRVTFFLPSPDDLPRAMAGWGRSSIRRPSLTNIDMPTCSFGSLARPLDLSTCIPFWTGTDVSTAS
jgi:hypothetical protein